MRNQMNPLYNSKEQQGEIFLSALNHKITNKEFNLLQDEAGFSPPNIFPIERLVQPLASKNFPTYGLREYTWAIHECDFNRLRGYSSWMKTYLSSIYIYCDKIPEEWMPVESDYYYLVIETALNDKEKDEICRLFISFIEWLYDWVPPNPGYDDYYCLLTWTFLRRMQNATSDKYFSKTLDLLLRKNYSSERLDELTVSERGISEWLKLHRSIPCHSESMRINFEKIILGQ